MKWIKLLIVNCSLLIGITAHAEPVSRINVSGNRRMDKESVRILADVKRGDNLNSENINQIAKRLQSSGYFSKVNVTMSGGTLNIALTEARR